jgi:hypothetical protein
LLRGRGGEIDASSEPAITELLGPANGGAGYGRIVVHASD